MTTRWSISLLIYMMVSAVLFGIGATTVLSVPSLSAYASVLLPAVVVASFILAVPMSYYVAPMMRSRYQRAEESRRRHEEQMASQR